MREKVVIGTGFSGGVPVGVVLPYAGASAPNGWLMCDGATASQTTYPDLYALVGATYGATGAGYFTLPDMRGRVAVGKGTNAAVDTLGESDGVAVANRRPQHRHTGHAHTTPTTNNAAGAGTVGVQGTDDGENTRSTSSVDGGSGNANDSLDAPAHLVLNYIIKAA